MTAEANERCYYIKDYTDEVMPCYPSLEAWADWLSKPDEEWRRPEPAADGETFKASVLRFDDDIIATRGPDGWSFSREIIAPDLLVVRFAQGAGWDADNILWATDGLWEQSLREWLTENDNDCDDVEYVAIGFNEPDVLLTFHAGPPATVSVAALQ